MNTPAHLRESPPTTPYEYEIENGTKHAYTQQASSASRHQHHPPHAHPHNYTSDAGDSGHTKIVYQSGAPKLTGPGKATRLLLLLACVCCFGCIVMALTAAINHFPFTITAVAAAPSPPRPLPALLQRFARLKRGEDRSASLKSIEQLFPSWNSVGDEVRDIAYAVTLLVQRASPPPSQKISHEESEQAEDADL